MSMAKEGVGILHVLRVPQLQNARICAFCCRIFLNLEMPEREYSKKGESMCPKDGWVVFRNSELICGRLGKGVLGGNKVNRLHLT